MAHRARLRTLWSSGAALCLTLGTVIALAGAANADDRPTATATSTVSGTTATITVAVNRGTNAIKSATCALDGTLIACGKPTSTGKKSASYQVTSTANGTHTFTIRVTLTDGGTATGSTTFDIVSAKPEGQTACEEKGGVYSQRDIFFWECDKTFDNPEDAYNDQWTFTDSLAPACVPPSGVDVEGDPMPYEIAQDGSTVTDICHYLTAQEFGPICTASGGYVGSTDEPPTMNCDIWPYPDGTYPAYDATLYNSLASVCGQLGGVETFQPGQQGVRRELYICSDPHPKH